MILVINPGSTSTKIALFHEGDPLLNQRVAHDADQLNRFPSILDQLEYRKQVIQSILSASREFRSQGLEAVIGRGGLLHPLEGGVYRINEAMKQDLRSSRYGAHASNLGALLADSLAREYGVQAFIADPVVVDELGPLARYTGIPELTRKSIFHALNQRATAKRAAAELGRPYGKCNLIVAHMGGGTSVALHEAGRITDVNNALDGDGPFSVERAGGLPAGDWLRYVLARSQEPAALQKRLTGRGGIVAHLGSNDLEQIERAIQAHLEGKEPGTGLDGARCLEVIRAMCYQVSKEICALAAVVEGKIDGVVLTGGMAWNRRIVEEVRRRVGFLARFLVYPGENEMQALAEAARTALNGDEPVLEYRPHPRRKW